VSRLSHPWALGAALAVLAAAPGLGGCASEAFYRVHFPAGSLPDSLGVDRGTNPGVLVWADFTPTYCEEGNPHCACSDDRVSCRAGKAAFLAWERESKGTTALEALANVEGLDREPFAPLAVATWRAFIHFSRNELDKATATLDAAERVSTPTADKTLFVSHTTDLDVIRLALGLHGQRIPAEYGAHDWAIGFSTTSVAREVQPRFDLPCPAGVAESGTMSPSDGHGPQILLPGRGIRGVVVGQSSVDDVLRVFGCDAFVRHDLPGLLVVDYDLSDSMPRAPQFDRPAAFVFRAGKLLRIAVSRRQINVRTPGGSRAGWPLLAEIPATTRESASREAGSLGVIEPVEPGWFFGLGTTWRNPDGFEMLRFPKAGIAFAFPKGEPDAAARAMVIFPPER
jgi:hypothetical protein